MTDSQLTIDDYKTILNYYKLNIPASKRLIKLNAEKILREKLCRCIKKIDAVNEARSIGICTKSVFNSKGLTRGKFKCKGKTKSIVIRKHNKTIKINKTLKK